MNTKLNDHVAKRETLMGRWAPVGFYLLNVVLWFLTGVIFDAWHLLWLVLLTVPALVFYFWRTRWNRISS